MRVEPYDTDRQAVFTRRAALLGGFTSLLFAGVTGRLYQLQVVDFEQYADLSRDNQFNLRLLPPLRGEVLDRFGLPLASNRKNYRVLLIPEQAGDVEAALDALAKVIPLEEERRAKVIAETKRRMAFTPIEVQDNLSWDAFARINLEGPNLPGIQPNVGETRHYPMGSTVSSVVGYVGAVSQSEMTDDPLLRQPGFRIGKKGLERSFDKELRGAAGSMSVIVNAHGRVIRELRKEANAPQQGHTAVLTIDAELQDKAMKELDGESGAAVVLDIETGEILVMASAPSYDPNDFNVGIDPAKWKQLNQDPFLPLLNKPLSGTYPPGSTFKLVTSIAALEHGVVTPDETVHCSGRMWFGNRFFHCWKKEGHGPNNMRNAIKKSCDVYFYEIAKRLKIDQLHATAKKFGLGDVFDLEISGQKAGVVPNTDWKRANFNEPWYPGESLSVVIGQGYMTSNPLQLAVMTARIANGKRAVAPTLVRAVGEDVKPITMGSALDIDPAHLAVVRDGMDAVTNEGGGTAWRSRLPEPEYRFAGKTGTSQVRRITKEERAAGVIKNEDLPWERRDHALFVGFAPYDQPRYAISVVIEHGGSGSKAAGPRAREIMRAVLEKDPARQKPYGPSRGLSAGRTAPTPQPLTPTDRA